MTNTTCQICGRPIQANTGVIAHHGYTREGGWQTQSCMGARHLPYEVSCDLLPVAIESIEDYISNLENQIDSMISNPPASFKVQIGYYGEEIIVERPENFDTSHISGFGIRSYQGAFCKQKNDFMRDIKNCKSSLAFMQDRLAKWVKVA